MNTKFTILIAAGLLFAGVSQAQGTAAAEFNNKPRHEMVARHEIKKNHHKMNRHHKAKHHHRKMRHGQSGRH